MAEWLSVAPAQALTPAGRALVRLGDLELAVFRVGGALYALEDRCPHGGASLCTGKVEGGHVQCRAHGLRFRLGDGALAGTPAGAAPSAMSVRTFAAREADGWLQLRFDAGPRPPGAALNRGADPAPGAATVSAACRTGC